MEPALVLTLSYFGVFVLLIVFVFLVAVVCAIRRAMEREHTYSIVSKQFHNILAVYSIVTFIVTFGFLGVEYVRGGDVSGYLGGVSLLLRLWGLG